jgi:hypothetical protein
LSQPIQSIDLFTPQDKPYGYTYGNWTVRWWNWAYSAPKEINPVLDETGEYACINQEGPVWFLAGTFGEMKYPSRRCTVPVGKSVLFPVINYETNGFEQPEVQMVSEFIEHARKDMDDIVMKEVIIDGENIPTFRISSDPPLFSIHINKNLGSDIKGGHTLASADGFWVFLKQLSVGPHTIYFHGACSGGQRRSIASYKVTVV